MAAKHSFNINSLIECPICLSECDDPRVLPCLHSLCKKCLQEHIKTSARGSHFNCPSCRHQCDVPPGGVTAFPKNFLFNSLIEMLQQQSAHDAAGAFPKVSSVKVTDKECSNNNQGNVQHTTATVFCVECAEFYCSNCETSHKAFSMSRGHRLRPAGEVDAGDFLAADTSRLAQKCDQHRAQCLDMYCDTCSVPMCMKCCLLNHKQHEYRELDQKAKESKAQLAELAKTAINLISSLDKRLQELDVSQRNIEKDGKEAYEQVSKTAIELRAIITNREQSLIKEIQNSQKTALTQVRADHKETEINKAGVQSLHSYIHTLQVSGKLIDQVVHTPGLQEQLRQQEAAPLLQSMTWTVNVKRETQSVAALNAMFGTVSVNQTTVTSGIIPDDMTIALSTPVLSLNPGVDKAMSGLAVVDECVCVTGYYEAYLWIHNMKTNTNKQHTLDGLQAVGMTTLHKNMDNTSNELVITDDKKKLHFITISPQNLDIIKHTVKDIPFEPRHVSVDPVTGKLIIANYTDKQIAICDNTGKICQTRPVKTSIGLVKCSLSTGDSHIVLDYNQGRVHWVNIKGDVTHTYGQRDGEDLYYPEHMALDSQGRLVVADTFNHRLHLIDVNRQLSHYLLTESDDIKNPYCICLDEATEQLFVGHIDLHNVFKVSMYRWPFTLGTHHTLRLQLTRFK